MSNNKEKLTELDYHEALDRAYLMASIVESTLIELPVIVEHKSLQDKVQKAINLLAEVYQELGASEFSLFSNNIENSNSNEIT